MSKLHLLLIHCSNILRPRKDKRDGKNFQLLVIHGGDRSTTDFTASSWALASQLVELDMTYLQPELSASTPATHGRVRHLAPRYHVRAWLGADRRLTAPIQSLNGAVAGIGKRSIALQLLRREFKRRAVAFDRRLISER
jgi:hypothetical protein